MSKTVYLAGPINGCSDSECNDWRANVKLGCEGACKFRNPMDRDYRGVETANVAEIVEGDKEDIRMSDIVFANASKNSAGTSMEIMLAWQLGKTVITYGSPSPWVKYHSTHYCQTLEEAVRKLKEELV